MSHNPTTCRQNGGKLNSTSYDIKMERFYIHFSINYISSSVEKLHGLRKCEKVGEKVSARL